MRVQEPACAELRTTGAAELLRNYCGIRRFRAKMIIDDVLIPIPLLGRKVTLGEVTMAMRLKHQGGKGENAPSPTE